MSSTIATKGRRRKDEKPPPPVGPGSKVSALPFHIKRHVITRQWGPTNRYDLKFDTVSAKKLPIEIYKNEELMGFARNLEAPNNRIKKMPRAISALSSLQVIDLRNNSMSTLPASISQLKSLSHLNVSGNGLRRLPARLHRASALTDVRASDNRLRVMPARLATAPNLMSLDLSNNIIKSLNKNVYKQPMSLNASHNCITSLPAVTIRNPSIHAIDISHNQLTSLPTGIENLTRLVHLDLSHNELTVLPAEIGQLRFLEWFSVASNRLQLIPDELGHIGTALVELNISNNSIMLLPDSIGCLRRLTVLDASNNLLQVLPSTMRELVGLIRIDLSHNQLRDVSMLSSLPECDIADWSYNELGSLPDDIERMKSLVELNVSNNQLTSLPDSLGRIRPLKRILFANNAVAQLPDTLGSQQTPTHIDATGNQLESIINTVEPSQQQVDLRRFRMVESFLLAGNQLASLPRHFDQLPSLEVLDVANNKLGSFTFPRTVTRLSVAGNPLHLPNDDPRGSLLVRISDERHSLWLTHLDVSNVQLTEVPTALCFLRQLVDLNLSHNSISAWPEKIFRLRNLVRFDFSHNAFSSLERFGAFTKLEHLDGSHNQIEEFPVELTTLRFLQTIDLSFNSIKFLPDSPGQLSRLVTFNLESNNIVNFPVDHLDVLASLLLLNVSNNHIDRFPTEFPYLYRLHVILAATNDLTELPKDIGLRMKGLVQLDVSDNMIASIPESIVKCPNLKEFNIKDNKVVQMPSCFDALRQKVKVEFEGQSSYKFREPVDRQRPSVPQSDANTDQKPAEKQPTVGKQRKSKSAKKGKAAKVTLNDVIVAPPAVAGEVIAEQTAETDAPAPTDGATANGVDDQLTDKGHAQELQQKSLTIS